MNMFKVVVWGYCCYVMCYSETIKRWSLIAGNWSAGWTPWQNKIYHRKCHTNTDSSCQQVMTILTLSSF